MPWPYPFFHTVTRGMSDGPDPFTKRCLICFIGCHQLPIYSVQYRILMIRISEYRSLIPAKLLLKGPHKIKIGEIAGLRIDPLPLVFDRPIFSKNMMRKLESHRLIGTPSPGKGNSDGRGLEVDKMIGELPLSFQPDQRRDIDIMTVILFLRL